MTAAYAAVSLAQAGARINYTFHIDPCSEISQSQVYMLIISCTFQVWQQC